MLSQKILLILAPLLTQISADDVSSSLSPAQIAAASRYSAYVTSQTAQPAYTSIAAALSSASVPPKWQSRILEGDLDKATTKSFWSNVPDNAKSYASSVHVAIASVVKADSGSGSASVMTTSVGSSASAASTSAAAASSSASNKSGSSAASAASTSAASASKSASSSASSATKNGAMETGVGRVIGMAAGAAGAIGALML